MWTYTMGSLSHFVHSAACCLPVTIHASERVFDYSPVSPRLRCPHALSLVHVQVSGRVLLMETTLHGQSCPIPQAQELLHDRCWTGRTALNSLNSETSNKAKQQFRHDWRWFLAHVSLSQAVRVDGAALLQTVTWRPQFLTFYFSSLL